MGLKTFNLDEETYKKYSSHCKEHGISMSKRVEGFIRQEIEKIGNASPHLQTTQPKQIIETKTSEKHSMRRYC